MSSFFAQSTAKRKRSQPQNQRGPPPKRRRDLRPSSEKVPSRQHRSQERDESISGSDSNIFESGNEDAGDQDETTSTLGEDSETGAERRTRLAERYLQNLKEEIDETGFDAADLDRNLIAERLKEDVSESKGRLYRHIAQDYDFHGAIPVQLRPVPACTTCVAVHAPYIYTAHKDMTIVQWKMPPDRPIDLPTLEELEQDSKPRRPRRRRPVKLKSTKGVHRLSSSTSSQHHSASILCMAVSPDGRFLATGGADKRLIIWSTETLEPLRVFSQHRDAVLGLAFRRGTNQLYSSSADRTIKTWSLNELAYVETLFGHQDAVVDVAALTQERCLSAGARDRTVRLWKVVEETQLVFRSAGGTENARSTKSKSQHPKDINGPSAGLEGSVERVAFIDDDTFVSGSDNGTISLWSMHKKKPIFSIEAAHGFDPQPPADDYFAEVDIEGRVVLCVPLARWITALTVVPYSDVILSGSWDGYIKAWKISADRRRIETLGCIGAVSSDDDRTGVEKAVDGHDPDSYAEQSPARGVINDIAFFEEGKRDKETLYVVAALGKEHRLGRWKKVKGRNGAVLFEISKRSAQLIRFESDNDLGA